MKARHFYHSLGANLVGWFLLLSFLPLLGVSWYAYNEMVKSVTQIQHLKLQQSAEEDMKRLEERFDETYKNLSYWAQSSERQEFMLQVKDASHGMNLESFVQSADFQKMQGYPEPLQMAKIKKNYEYVHDLFLIDLEGNILYSVVKEADLGTSLINGPYQSTRFAKAFRATLSDRKSHFSDLEQYQPSNGVLAGFITAPMYDTDGTMVGVMAVQLNMNIVFGDIALNNKGFNNYLVGEDGLLRTKLNSDDEVLHKRINTKVFWNWHNEHAEFKKFRDDMEEGAISYIGPHGNQVVGQHHAINLLGVKWAHISEINEETLMVTPNHLAKMMLLFVLIAFIVVVLVAILIARRITEPIRELSNASNQYMNGVKGVYVSLNTKNELGEFGEVFNALIEKQETDAQKMDLIAQKAHKTLEELKEQKYALDAHSIVAITDVKGTITFVNSKFEEISGYTSRELIGQNHRLLNSGYHDVEFWKAMYHTVSHGNIWHGEVYNRAKTGVYYWVDTTIVPFMGEDGKPESYIAIRTDITERKAIQESLNEAMSLQKAIFENAGVAIITTDKEGMITAFNAAAQKLLGYSSEEIVGKQNSAIFHKLDEVVARAQELSQELGEEVEPGFKVFVIKSDKNLLNAYEWTYIRKDGSEVPIYLNVTALHDGDGKTIGYVGMASDISLFKEAEAQMILSKEAAESSARIKAEFLATMSHEIRTPMNGVLGMLGLLSHSNLDETQQHQVRVASNSANSLLTLINDILDFSKVEAGKMELEMIEFDLREEVGDLIEAIAFRAQEKGLELILDTTQLTRSSVISDPGRLRQILTNLLGNAIKFTHRGEILVTVKLIETDQHHGRLLIDVRDSGIGIAADKIDLLFQTFSQADNSTTRKYGGTGLGLAIVKKLCELMNGSVWITSVERQGSTFHVDIGVELGEKSTHSIPSVSVEGKSVLVVDDNETNRAVVRAQLEYWGMKVYEAEDAIVAYDACTIRLAQGHVPPYDVAIVDMQMPNMDGIQLGTEIRQNPQCDAMKLVMMTSLGSRHDAQKFAKIGFDAYFAKPTTTKDLLNALRLLFDEESALEGGGFLVTKDYLGTFEDESESVQWPSDVRLLLVDDNSTNQIVAQGLLGMIGLEADVASNGLEALESMRLAIEMEAPYTLVLMDCQMPEMDGYAASSAIREGKAGDAHKNVPIIAMTANAMAGDREKCLVSGMNDYVSKPINDEILKSTLIKWLHATVLHNNDRGSHHQEAKLSEDVISQQLVVWDEATALKRLRGNKELLHKIMESFVDEGASMMIVLNEAIMHDDIDKVQLYAHSIKGSAGNLSAQKVQAVAQTIEFAAKNGDKSIVTEGYVTLKKAMDEVMALFDQELTKAFKPFEPKKHVDSLQMVIWLQSLKKEIENGAFIDTDSLGIFVDYDNRDVTVQMYELKAHIDRFDSDKALAVLDMIMTELE